MTRSNLQDGTVVLVHDLLPGQHIVVLQLPADANESGHRVEGVAAGQPVREPAFS
jgi:hypothetical protein